MRFATSHMLMPRFSSLIFMPFAYMIRDMLPCHAFALLIAYSTLLLLIILFFCRHCRYYTFRHITRHTPVSLHTPLLLALIIFFRCSPHYAYFRRLILFAMPAFRRCFHCHALRRLPCHVDAIRRFTPLRCFFFMLYIIS